MLKAIAAIATTGAIATLAAAPAQAIDLSEYTFHPGGGHINGYTVEGILESPSMDQPDYIEIYGPSGKEEIVVLCSPFYWESTGPNTAAFSEATARQWCF